MALFQPVANPIKTGTALCDENKLMHDGFQNYKYLSNQKWLFRQVKQARNIIRKWKAVKFGVIFV